MDTGNFNLEPIAYDEYRTKCLSNGLTRKWEIKLSYKVYLEWFWGSYKKGSLILYYNRMYFNEGSFN